MNALKKLSKKFQTVTLLVSHKIELCSEFQLKWLRLSLVAAKQLLKLPITAVIQLLKNSKPYNLN